MRKLRDFFTTLLSAALTTAAAQEADVAPRSWAVIAGMNLSCPTVSTDNRHSLVDGGKTASFSSPMGNVLLEYYVPQTHFSVVGGYNAETLGWYGDDVTATMRNVTLGARYYPLSPSFAIQPYASLAAYLHVGEGSDTQSMSCVSGSGYSYERNATIDCPRVSFAPVVGADIYLFSSLAIELQYGFPLAIGGDTRISSVYGGNATANAHSRMHRHNVQIGLKATFPFHFSTGDASNIFDLIYMALGIYDPDEHPKQTKADRKRQNLQNVLKSY